MGLFFRAMSWNRRFVAIARKNRSVFPCYGMGEKDGGVDSGMDLDGRGVDGGVDGAMHAAGGRERRGLMAHGWESGTVCFGRPAGPYRLRRPTGRFSLASGTMFFHLLHFTRRNWRRILPEAH